MCFRIVFCLSMTHSLANDARVWWSPPPKLGVGFSTQHIATEEGLNAHSCSKHLEKQDNSMLETTWCSCPCFWRTVTWWTVHRSQSCLSTYHIQLTFTPSVLYQSYKIVWAATVVCHQIIIALAPFPCKFFSGSCVYVALFVTSSLHSLALWVLWW